MLVQLLVEQAADRVAPLGLGEPAGMPATVRQAAIAAVGAALREVSPIGLALALGADLARRRWRSRCGQGPGAPSGPQSPATAGRPSTT